MIKKWLRGFLCLLLAPVLAVLLYLSAAVIGAVIPVSPNTKSNEGPLLFKPVYLIGTLLHTDIAIPVNSLSLTQFAFLREAGVPLDNPELKYLIIGWGSRGFYTETADYSDIKFGTAWRAATGDASVMHVGPAGDLADVEGVEAISMTHVGFANMLQFILEDFKQSENGPILMPDTFGYGDVFYESPDRFNILKPCNIWASYALSEAGIGTGIWTPTSYSLRLAHWLHN